MKKRFFQLVLTAVLSVSCVATGVNVSAAPLSSEGYSIEKVSHPERGAGETDGILSFDAMGEESNRNQSYVWSCVEHGNYIYLGTCWNPISGIYYRNLKNNLTKLFQNRGDENPAQTAGTERTAADNTIALREIQSSFFSVSTHKTFHLIFPNEVNYFSIGDENVAGEKIEAYPCAIRLKSVVQSFEGLTNITVIMSRLSRNFRRHIFRSAGAICGLRLLLSTTTSRAISSFPIR